MKTKLKKNLDDLKGFSWFNYDYFPDSMGCRFEIYMSKDDHSIDSLINLFNNLFDNDLAVGQPNLDAEWGQFCIETWNFENDMPDYDLDTKSLETINYLNFLIESKIEFDYTGLCSCEQWDEFLNIILNCIINHKAPYSPLFYNFNNNYLFYFHHTYSLGFYYKEHNAAVSAILKKIQKGKYEIKNSNSNLTPS